MAIINLSGPDKNGTYKVTYENGVPMGEFYREVDGYYVWEPVLRGGYLGEGLLRAMSDKLKELNAPWEAQVIEYFDRLPDDSSCDTMNHTETPGEFECQTKV